MEDSDFQQKSAQIRQLASVPPEKLAEHLGATHQTLQNVAPNIAPHVHSTAFNAINFLNSRLPGAGNELIQDPHQEPSKAEKSQWLDLHSVVNNPLSVLDHVQNGTLNHHHVEALNTVYPDLHAEMVSKIGEQLGKLKSIGKELPYQKRLQVGMLMGSPLDSTMTPQSMQAAMMANRGANIQTQGKQPKKASGVELDQFNKVNEMAATPLQKRQIGKD
jgi:hypothetical protein